MIGKYSLAADRNECIETHLDLRSENGYKAKSYFLTTICCGSIAMPCHNIWWCFQLLK